MPEKIPTRKSQEKLNQNELRVFGKMLSEFNIEQRLTQKPLLVAMVGLVGSGKSIVARELAQQIKAPVVNSDQIRAELKELGETSLDGARIYTLAEKLALEVIHHGGNAVLDSDFIGDVKRSRLDQTAAREKMELRFFQVRCDLDTAIQRVISSDPNAVTRIREMVRRMPLHYKWLPEGGGKWVPRDLPFPIMANFSTTDEGWRNELPEHAQKLLEL